MTNHAPLYHFGVVFGGCLDLRLENQGRPGYESPNTLLQTLPPQYLVCLFWSAIVAMNVILYDQASKGRTSRLQKAAINYHVAKFSRQKAGTSLTYPHEGLSYIEPIHVRHHECVSGVYETYDADQSKSRDSRREIANVKHKLQDIARRYMCEQYSTLPAKPVLDFCPFGLLPFEQKLMHHYIHNFSRSHFGLPENHQTLPFDSLRDINFPLALQHPILFRTAILSLSAGHLSSLNHPGSARLFQYEQSVALQEMRVFLDSTSYDCSDIAIAMCVFRAIIDGLQGESGQPIIHIRAALQMAFQRGGPSTLRTNRGLLMLLINFSWRFAREDISINPRCPGQLIMWENSSLELDTDQQFEEFLISCRLLSMKQRSQIWLQRVPLRHVIFAKNSLVGTMLRRVTPTMHSLPFDNEWLEFLAVIVFLNHTLLDLENDFELTNIFLYDFAEKLEMLKLCGHQSVKAIVQVIIQQSMGVQEDEGHWRRLWFAGRMLRWAVSRTEHHEKRVMFHMLATLTMEDVSMETTAI